MNDTKNLNLSARSNTGDSKIQKTKGKKKSDLYLNITITMNNSNDPIS